MNQSQKQLTGFGKLLPWLFYASCLLLALSELTYEKHPYNRFEGWHLFYPAAGFLATLALYLGSQAIGFVIRREEDYYDR